MDIVQEIEGFVSVGKHFVNVCAHRLLGALGAVNVDVQNIEKSDPAVAAVVAAVETEAAAHGVDIVGTEEKVLETAKAIAAATDAPAPAAAAPAAAAPAAEPPKTA